jgi:hypothetical protein
MSRASDITLFLIILQASAGFVNATGLFTQNYYATPQNQYSYTVQNLSDYSRATTAPGLGDYITILAAWTWQAFFIGIQVVFAVVFVLPLLVITFKIPIILSTFMQVGVYYVYATWYAQWKSGKGWRTYE